MSPPPSPSGVSILSLAELAERLTAHPSAVHVGAGLTVALSGKPIVWREFLQRGLQLALEHRLLTFDQLKRQLEAIESADLEERTAVGGFIESKLRPRTALFDQWLRTTVGELELLHPAVAAPLAAASKKGILLSSNNYETLLSQATGLPALTWRNFRSHEQLLHPPTILHTDGIWNQPESIVLSVRRDAEAALHRDAVQNYLGPLRFILFVGVGSGFFITDLADALKSRRGTLPGAILCREEDVAFFSEHITRDLPWISLVPYPGGFEALPEALAEVFGSAELPGLPPNTESDPQESPPASPREPRILVPDAGSEVLDLAFGHDGIVTGQGDSTVAWWNHTGSPGPKVTTTGRSVRIWAVAKSQISSIAVAGSETDLFVWTLPKSYVAAISEMPQDQSTVWSLAFNPTSTLLASARDGGNIEIWSLEAPPIKAIAQPRPFEFIDSANAHDKGALAVAFHPTDSILASAGHDRTIRFWTVPGLQPSDVFHGHDDWVGSLAFSPDGSTLASTGGDLSVILWDFPSGQQRWRSRGHSDRVQSLSFHPSGQLIATGGWDKTVRIWDAASGKQLKVFEGHTDRVWTVAFSPDGAWLASGGDDRTIRLWPIDVESLRRTAPSEAASTTGGPSPSAAASVPLPPEFLDLARSPARLSAFLARLPLRHPEAIPLLESLEPGCLADALRPTPVLAATSPVDFANRALELEKSQSGDFTPPPLWLAWMQHVRASEVARLGQQMIALAERAVEMNPTTPASPTDSVTEPPEPKEVPVNKAGRGLGQKALRRKTRPTKAGPPPDTEAGEKPDAGAYSA